MKLRPSTSSSGSGGSGPVASVTNGNGLSLSGGVLSFSSAPYALLNASTNTFTGVAVINAIHTPNISNLTDLSFSPGIGGAAPDLGNNAFLLKGVALSMNLGTGTGGNTFSMDGGSITNANTVTATTVTATTVIATTYNGSGASLTGITAAQVGADASGAAATVQGNLSVLVNSLGSAAYQSTAAFDAAGSAASVQGNLTTAITNIATIYAPKASPTFSGTVAGITATMVGLGNVSNSLQLTAANNLSDLVSAATARTNLGLGTAATTAASAYAPAAGSTSITTLGTIATGSVPASLVTGLTTYPVTSVTQANGLTLTSGTLAFSGAAYSPLAGSASITTLGTIATGSIPASLVTGLTAYPVTTVTTGNGLSLTSGTLSFSGASYSPVAGSASITTLGTITAGSIPASLVTGPGSSTILALSAVSNLVATNASSIAILTPIASLTLTASTWTMSNPIGSPYDGQKVIWRLVQDATGSRTISWGTAFDWGTGTAPTLSAAANATDYVLGIYNSANSKWHMASGATGGF